MPKRGKPFMFKRKEMLPKIKDRRMEFYSAVCGLLESHPILITLFLIDGKTYLIITRVPI